LVHCKDCHAVRNGVVEAEVGLSDAYGIRERAAAGDDNDRRTRAGQDAQDGSQPPAFGEAAAELDDRRRWRPPSV
jgi:hypothetical protein